MGREVRKDKSSEELGQVFSTPSGSSATVLCHATWKSRVKPTDRNGPIPYMPPCFLVTKSIDCKVLIGTKWACFLGRWSGSVSMDFSLERLHSFRKDNWLKQEQK